MRFFKRDEAPPTDFWTWWAGTRDRVAAAIEGGGFDKGLIDEVSKAVRGVDPRLAWEFAPGHAAKHALCITPEGNSEIRPIALRWLAGAPPADAAWEYHAARQAAPTLMVLEVGGDRVPLEDMRAISSWDENRQRLDVRLWHGAFDRLPEPARLQAAFLFLDNLLGEDDVERWVGQIDMLEAPSGGKTPGELKAEVARHAAEPAGATWVLGQMSGPDGQPMIVVADAALKRIDHPYADIHVAVRIRLDDGGMPDDACAASLNAEEDRLVGLLGDAAVLAGRTTTPGERVIHFVAASRDAVRAAVDQWAADAPDWRVKVEFSDDVNWSFQRRLGVR
jgi:hypothetical protein